uniref:RNA-directed DNA polymerase n=1 Tax=Panagrolaimus superbus TaxID=310955 RepID=A0A914Z7V0_9BILA
MRPNTVQYSTSAIHCYCINAKDSHTRGFFGGHTYGEVKSATPITAAECAELQAEHGKGGLIQFEGFAGTAHKPQFPDRNWPFWMQNDEIPVKNCYIANATVLSQYGTPFIQKSMAPTISCDYQAGECQMDTDGVMLWKPEKKQTCKFVEAMTFNGSFSAGMFVDDRRQLALTFDSATYIIDCDASLVISDQGYAVFQEVFEEAKSRPKRHVFSSVDVGPVYSNQLAAQLTALQHNTDTLNRQSFSTAIQYVCSSIQHVLKSMFAMAAANPTLLARDLLNVTDIRARLVTADILEVQTCEQIPLANIQFTRLEECFNLLPVELLYQRKRLQAFLDPVTLIIEKEAAQVDCRTVSPIYLPTAEGVMKYDQATGDVRLITDIRAVSKFINREIPDLTLLRENRGFHNLVLTNLSELYNFKAYQESANRAMSVKQLIHQLSTIEAASESMGNPQVLELAQKVVSEGLFGFLRGGLWDLSQGWIFCTCLVTTLQLLAKYFLPIFLQDVLRGLNLFAAAGFARHRVVGWRARRQQDANAALLPSENHPAIQAAEAPQIIQGRPIHALWPHLPTENDTEADVQVATVTPPRANVRVRFSSRADLFVNNPLDATEIMVLEEVFSAISDARAVDVPLLAGKDTDEDDGISAKKAKFSMELEQQLGLLGATTLTYLDDIMVSPASGQETRYVANSEVIRHLLLVASGIALPPLDVGGPSLPGADPSLSFTVRPTPTPANVPPAAGAMYFTAEMMAHGSSKAHVMATIQDIDFVSLLDTGAALSLITKNLADKLGLEVYPAAPINLMGIGQSIFRTEGIVEVMVQVGEGPIPVIAQVYDPPRQPSYEMLIGCDTMIKLPPITYDFQKQMITFGVYEAEIFQVTGAEVKELLFPPTDAETAEHPQLYNLLNGYTDIISTSELDLGCCTETAPPVVLTGPLPKPVKMYRTADVDKAAVKQFVEDGLKAKIIRPSTNASVVSNVVVVNKGNGAKRVCVDLRRLNSVVQLDPYPLADMSELIQEASGAAWFSCIDLASGFLQIPLDPSSIPLFGFVCHEGVFEFMYLPFGYKNAPGIFQRVMKHLLADLPFAKAYLDDILIWTRIDSLRIHLEHVRAVLDRLRLFNLKLRAAKCQIAKRSVCYVGHLLDKHGYAPSPKHVEAFKKLAPPANVKQLRTFMGMINFFHKFVDSFAQVAGPLNALLRKGAPFDWQPPQQHAFEQLIEVLTTPPVLQPPHMDKPFLIYSDASSRGIGAAILQAGDDGLAHVVMYVSRGLLPAEMNYAIGELELLALVFTLQHQRALLLGRKIKWFTDNKPLSCLSQKIAKSPRIQRWLIEIQGFDIEFAHVPGIENAVADGLSRFATEINAVETTPDPSYGHLLRAAMTEDPLLQEVMEHVQHNWMHYADTDNHLKAFSQTRGNLRIRKGLLFFKNRLIVPLSLRPLVLEILHRSHLGADRMIRLSQAYVWWPNSAADIREFVAICAACKGQAKAAPKKPVTSWPQATQPWQRMHIDYAGPFEGSMWLVLVDAASKFVFIERMSITTSKATIIILDKIFSYFGFPDVLVSDNGPQLVSAEFNQYLYDHGVRHLTAPPYHPESNGLAERMVQTFKTALKKIREHDPEISVSAALRMFLWDYRNVPHSATGVAPAIAIFGRLHAHPLDLFRRGEGTTAERVANAAPAAAAAAPQPVRFEMSQPVWRRILNPVEIRAKNRKTEAAVIQSAIGNRMFQVRDDSDGSLHVMHEDDLSTRAVSTRLARLIANSRDVPEVEQATLSSSSSSSSTAATNLAHPAPPASSSPAHPVLVFAGLHTHHHTDFGCSCGGVSK